MGDETRNPLVCVGIMARLAKYATDVPNLPGPVAVESSTDAVGWLDWLVVAFTVMLGNIGGALAVRGGGCQWESIISFTPYSVHESHHTPWYDVPKSKWCIVSIVFVGLLIMEDLKLPDMLNFPVPIPSSYMHV